MSALLQPRVEPPIYLYDVAAQDRMRDALSGLYDQLHALECEWCDVFEALLDSPSDPELNARYDELKAQVHAIGTQIVTAKAAL